MAKDLNMSVLLDFYGGLLTEKQQNAIDLYYNQDLSLSEIAQEAGITRQGVRDAVKRAEAQLIEMEEQLGLAARFRAMQGYVKEIGQAVEQIEQINAEQFHSDKIDACADKINKLVRKLDD